jgi:hypothetical protein
MVADLTARLEAAHGARLVRAVLGFMSVASAGGLSESELAHLLSLDDDALAELYAHHVPALRRAPLLPLLALLRALAPLLSRLDLSPGQQVRPLRPACCSFCAQRKGPTAGGAWRARRSWGRPRAICRATSTATSFATGRRCVPSSKAF